MTRAKSLTHCLTCNSVIFTVLSISLVGRNKTFVLAFQQTPNLPASPTHRYCNFNWNQHEAPSASKDNKAAYLGEKLKEQRIIQLLVFKVDLE